MQVRAYTGGHMRQTSDGLVLTAVRSRTGEVRFPPPSFLHGEDEVEPVALGPVGSLYTFTVVHVGKDAPYGLAMVDFEPGIRVFGRLVFDTTSPPRLGTPVRVIPFQLGDGTPDYAFEPWTGAGQ